MTIEERKQCPDCEQCQMCAKSRCRQCKKEGHEIGCNELGCAFTQGEYLEWKKRKRGTKPDLERIE